MLRRTTTWWLWVPLRRILTHVPTPCHSRSTHPTQAIGSRPHYAPVHSKLVIFALCLLTAGCSSVPSTTTGTWRASVDNGDKPGIGIELTRHAETITGRMFLLDPNRPKDFAAGSARPMRIQYFTDTEIRFAVDWRSDVHDEMILWLSSPLQGQTVHGVLESVDRAGTPRDYEFVRTR